jgi:hypothetical protein
VLTSSTDDAVDIAMQHLFSSATVLLRLAHGAA